MKYFYSFCFFCFFLISNGQNTNQPDKYTAHNKGKFFVFWGGNGGDFSKSDITFKGKNYNFTLYDVTSKDRPTGLHIDYLNPTRMTIPQTNVKVGYFFSDHYNISVGVDHMKYVMNQYQTVRYSGNYPAPGIYSELQPNNNILLTEDFLQFEHTDGLNFVHTEIARVDDISSIFKIKNTDKIQINITEGVGAGLMFPRSNTRLMDKERYDEFHLSGYGMSAKVGLNITFWKHFFVQTELKGGYINMNDIRTTKDPEDSASQSFFFVQRIIAFGGIFKL